MTRINVAFDLPTQLGLDSDDPRAVGEVGNVGVPVDTLATWRCFRRDPAGRGQSR